MIELATNGGVPFRFPARAPERTEAKRGQGSVLSQISSCCLGGFPIPLWRKTGGPAGLQLRLSQEGDAGVPIASASPRPSISTYFLRVCPNLSGAMIRAVVTAHHGVKAMASTPRRLNSFKGD